MNTGPDKKDAFGAAPFLPPPPSKTRAFATQQQQPQQQPQQLQQQPDAFGAGAFMPPHALGKKVHLNIMLVTNIHNLNFYFSRPSQSSQRSRLDDSVGWSTGATSIFSGIKQSLPLFTRIKISLTKTLLLNAGDAQSRQRQEEV